MTITSVPLIRAECTQMGLAIEASDDNGGHWIAVILILGGGR